MWYKNLCGTFFRFVTIHACDGQTDGQTDTFAVRKTPPCILQRGKNLSVAQSSRCLKILATFMRAMVTLDKTGIHERVGIRSVIANDAKPNLLANSDR